MRSVRYPISLAITEEEAEQLDICKAHKYKIVEIFRMGLEEAVKRIEHGEKEDK